MNKKHLKVALLSLMCTSMALSYTSCKDYDDDISNLQGQIDGIKVTLDELQATIDGGKVITGVTATADGLVVTLSDNKSYTISNGKDGSAADVWTIGDDGMWYKNGKVTQYRAIGIDGLNGTNGTDGADGTNGTNGTNGKDGEDGEDGKDGSTIYYYPNPETGKFDKYENGKKVEETSIVWRTSSESSMSVTLAGTRLQIAGLDPENPENTVVINSGVTVGSVAFVPTVVCKDLPYATTDKPFYHIASYLTETKYNASKEFVPQAWDKSNIVDLLYRVNPTGATITEKDKVSFINRGVESRAEAVPGDFTKLLKEKSHKYNEGQLTVSALYNKTQAISGKYDIVAAQLWQGQDPYVSDYIAVSSEAVDAAIVNPLSTPKYAEYYERDKAITSADAETDAFVKQFVKLSDACNLDYDITKEEPLDLNQYVELYSLVKKETLTKLGFDGISYKFSLPKSYLAADEQKTDQQWFVTLSEDGKLSLNSENLEGGIIAATGRTPVVRVDAYMEDNDGVAQMVASSYIKVKITDESEDPEQPDKTRDAFVIGTAEYTYTELGNDLAIVKNVDGKDAKMSWQEINAKIYGVEGLTSQNFWGNNTYGTANGTQYTVEVAVQQNGQDVVLNPNNKTATVGQVFSPNVPGLATEVLFGKGDTETAYVSFKINNLVKTDATYDNVDGKGAKYTITITLPSNNLKAHPNIVIKEVIYVLNDYQPYKANPNYEVTGTDLEPGNAGADITVRTKGIRNTTDKVWEMKLNIKEAFLRINDKDITEYFALNNNVAETPEIAFALDPVAQPGFTYDATNYLLSRTAAMEKDKEIAHMKYTVTLKNGEELSRRFDVNFINPFQEGTIKGVELAGNKIGGDSEDVKPSVLVVDKPAKETETPADIYKWNPTTQKLELTDTGKNTYFLLDDADHLEVVYAFDETFGNYKDFKGQLVTGSKFEVDAETGFITFENLGAELQQECNARVIATVTFKNLSVVKVYIPVKVTTASK